MAESIKNFYASTTGQILKQITPSFVLDTIDTLEYPIREESIANYRQLLLQRTYDERTSYYKTLIREHQFQKESLHILCPTIESCTALFEVLKKNNQHIYLFHSGMTKKQSRTTYTTLARLDVPSVLVSTPGCIDMYQYRRKTIIIEDESSEYYRTVSAPYLDMRLVAQEYAGHSQLTLVWAASALRPESYSLYVDNQADSIEPLNKRIFKTGDITIINQHSHKTKKQTDAERIQDLQILYVMIVEILPVLRNRVFPIRSTLKRILQPK